MSAGEWQGGTGLKIAIVGPGAIGCLFAALLSRGGQDVWLLDHRQERARVIARRGLWISGVSGEFHADVRATANPADVGVAGFVIVAVKSYDTEGAALTAAPLVGPDTVVLSLQNGLGNLETLVRHFGAARILGGVTAQGATLVSAGQIRHAGQGVTTIGELNGALTTRVRALAAAFSEADVHTELTAHLYAVLWAKLAVNAGINAIASIARVRNGGILESSHLRGIMAQTVGEVVAVAAGKGLEMPEADMASYTESVCQRTADNVNSMLQDINRQRRTEVDAINGAVVEEGHALGLPTPVNAALAALIRGLEQTYPARIG